MYGTPSKYSPQSKTPKYAQNIVNTIEKGAMMDFGGGGASIYIYIIIFDK